MEQTSDLITTDLDAYLGRQENKELLRLLTCGSVDDGKSTLIGRLLHDSRLIYEDQLEALKADSARSGSVEDGLDLALLVDGLQAERQQGITIDVAYRYFSTARRKFIIADTPGHEEYTRNMATGASNCDLAIILMDARTGVLTQTRRHTYIAALLGIKHLIVTINKMDLVDYDRKVFDRIRSDYADFSVKLDVRDIRYLPISALKGDNVVERSGNMPWYQSRTLMELLENIQISSDRNLSDFRFPVQYVNRAAPDFRGYSGTISSGIIRAGEDILVLPSRRTSRVKSISSHDGVLTEAFPPQAVTLTLEDDIDISRGDMLVHPDNLPCFSSRLEANIVWMAEEPLQPGRQYLFKQAGQKTAGRISALHFRVDVNTLEKQPAVALQMNETGRCEVSLTHHIAFDPYAQNRETGAFIIIDRISNNTVGAGMVVGVAGERDQWVTRAADSLSTVESQVSEADRRARFGQTPKTVFITGLTRSGKTTLAYALERRLFDMGRAATVLDGENVRIGASKDLGFDADSRSEHVRRTMEIAKLMNQAGLIVICALVAPSEQLRRRARDSIGEDFLLVHLSTPLAICRERDSKGFYEAAETGELDTVPGVNLEFETPTDAELVLPTHELSVEESVARLLELLETRGAFTSS